MSRLTRFGLCVLGYAIACIVGAGAVWLKNLGVSAAVMDASSGMFAFGDAITFLLFFAVASVPPTVGLLRLIELGPRFWSVYAVLGLLMASTGLLAAVLMFFEAGRGSRLEAVQMFAVLRVLAAPLSLLLFVPGVVLAAGRSRMRLLAACGIELAAVCVFALRMLLLR